MIDWLVNKLFWWTPIREAIVSEVHMYDYISNITNDPKSMEVASSFIPDFDGWRSWSFNEDNGRYYFNDVPEENMMSAMSALSDMEENIR